MSESTRSGPRTPPQIFDMLLAYKTTSMLVAGIEVGVFDLLAAGPMTAPSVADAVGLPVRGVRLLLAGLAALGLLDGDGSTYTLTEGSAQHLVRGEPGYVGDMARVMASSWEWDAFGRLTDAVRQGGPVVAEDAETPQYAYWEDFAAYAGAVARPTAGLAAATLAPWASRRPRLHVLDVACGHGMYGYTLAATQPHARVWSLDWPNVLPEARKHAAEMGLADRVEAIPGDMFEVPLGGPYDVAMVTNVLHHFAPERGVTLLRRVADARAEDGRLVLVGFVTGDGQPPARDAAAHLFSVLMLVWTQAGEVHSEATYQQMLDAAGFSTGQFHPVPNLPLFVIVSERK
jgi:cyclopropane fatty-acyl-phospholipid synthase-like methyltransferase